MADPAGLALVNGRILANDSGAAPTTRGAGTALLIEDGRIVAIGHDRAILDHARGRAEILDLDGAVVAPGFIDPHIHAFACAMAELEVSCLPPAVQTLAELIRRLAKRAARLPPGAWVVGRGYDDTRLAECRHPTRLDLDQPPRITPLWSSDPAAT